jgi:hypothetical protein
MKRLILHRGAYHVETPPRGPSRVIAGTMLGVFLIAALTNAVEGSWGAVFLWALLLGAPAFAVSQLWGSTKRHRVAAVVEAREVPGGALLAVMDVRNVRHDLVVDPAVARGLAVALGA